MEGKLVERFVQEVLDAVKEKRVISSGVEAEITYGEYGNKLTYTFVVDWPSVENDKDSGNLNVTINNAELTANAVKGITEAIDAGLRRAQRLR